MSLIPPELPFLYNEVEPDVAEETEEAAEEYKKGDDAVLLKEVVEEPEFRLVV